MLSLVPFHRGIHLLSSSQGPWALGIDEEVWPLGTDEELNFLTVHGEVQILIWILYYFLLVRSLHLEVYAEYHMHLLLRD